MISFVYLLNACHPDIDEGELWLTDVRLGMLFFIDDKEHTKGTLFREENNQGWPVSFSIHLILIMLTTSNFILKINKHGPNWWT